MSSLVVRALASKTERRRFESISGWMFFIACIRFVGPHTLIGAWAHRPNKLKAVQEELTTISLAYNVILNIKLRKKSKQSDKKSLSSYSFTFNTKTNTWIIILYYITIILYYL